MRSGLVPYLLAIVVDVCESAGVRSVRHHVISAQGDVEDAPGSEPQYVLHYFDIRARGEPLRFLLQVINADWEDKRYSFDLEKAQYGEDFLAARASGKLNASMGLVPLLEVHEAGKVFTMGQSQAIERFLASKHGIMGKDDEETAQVDMVSEHMRDIGVACSSLGICGHMGALTGPAFSRQINGMPQGKEKDQKYAKFFQEELPAFLEKLEASLPSQIPGYAVGSETSLADLKIFYFVKEALNVAPDEKIQWPPKILAIAERVAKFDSVKHHKETRPVRPF